MKNFRVIGPDVVAPDNQWPVIPPTPGFETLVEKKEEGSILYFLPGTHVVVPTGTGRIYRPIEVTGVRPMMWNHHTREVLMQQPLPLLYGAPLADCLIVSIRPDAEYEEREAAARQQAERRAASRRETNRRALERARARQAAAQAIATAPLAAASPAVARPAAAPLVPVPVAAVPLAPAPLALVLPAAAPFVPIPVAAAPLAPAPVAAALVAPADDAPMRHGAPVMDDWEFWNQFMTDEVMDDWCRQEAEAKGQEIPTIFLD
ncbi:uncharacterized protein EAE97_001275 [Botrytis byssoidea]|uniref:Uncharacterized protein n=1 Tax=Botrytis byssoidea TaxID=139641 RepID=A0A9P5IU68_9HELO|nr:uncharacterized protein EAE97_001275 [Botrytis byssoidea]KAF7953876.1 hypothetical protein EAE97_001275 [Botrytis byssoidea]